LIFDLNSWHSAPKSPEISWMIGIFWLMMQLLVGSCIAPGWGNYHQKAQNMIRHLGTFSPTLLSSKEKDGPENKCLLRSLHKNPWGAGLRKLGEWWTNMSMCWEGSIPNSTGTEAPTLRTLLDLPTRYPSSSGCYLYPL
jgi:hypothetical protein